MDPYSKRINPHDLKSREVVKPVRRACARGSKFGQDASLTHVASRRARAVRAKCSLVGLTTREGARGATKTAPIPVGYQLNFRIIYVDFEIVRSSHWI